MRQHIALVLYVLNALLIIVLLISYHRDVKGLWPPNSRRNFVIGWSWYISLYAVGIWLYVIEVQVMGLANNILLLSMGTVMLIIGTFIITWAFSAFRSIKKISGAEINNLITLGPYHYVRNPQYLGTILILLGLAALHNSLLILGFALLQIGTFYLLALLEERELERRFGEVYIEYKHMVPRFIPRLIIRDRHRSNP